ncbi:MAG: hypothetical protein Q9196_002786 [Gyalolechia fulgens]
MGNQISTVGRTRSTMPCDEERAASQSGVEETLSQQETLRAPSTIRERVAKLKRSISRNPSSFIASSASTPDAASIQSRKQFPSTDGTSTPQNEPFKIILPAPSLLTDARYLSLSLHTVSTSEASTITQGNLNAPNSPAARSSTPAPSFPARPRPSLSSTSTPRRSRSQARSASDTSSPWPHPYFPLRSFRLDKVPPAPLRPIHWACYQSHQRMLRSHNAQHPVPCMACGVDDERVRWKCVWCCLRICSECMEKLSKIEMRDLKALVPEFGSKVKRIGDCEQGDKSDCNRRENKIASTLAVKVGRAAQGEPS